MWVAKKTVKKAVFCVDSVGLARNEDDIRAHVSGMGVQVFTCFETKPRRRPNESADDVKDRKAFRLCLIGTAYSTRMFGQTQFVFLTGFISEIRRIKLL